MRPSIAHRPSDAKELAELIRRAAAGERRLELRGGGTRTEVGAPRDAEIVDMIGFSGVIDYDPAELVLTVGAGTPLAEIEALVASRNQMLAFEPHGAPGSTIGGVAAGVSGSRRSGLDLGPAAAHLQPPLAGRRTADQLGQLLGVRRPMGDGLAHQNRGSSGKAVRPPCTCMRPSSAQRCSTGNTLPGLSSRAGSKAHLTLC